MLKGLVSIIIPTYNRQKFICESIDSCLNQTYKNIEIIVIDDGSIDDTKKKIKDKYTNNIVKYFYKQNGGISSARNEGLRRAVGEFIQFLDSDDLLKENKIEKQVKFLQNNMGIFAVYCGTEYFKRNIKNIVFKKFTKHKGEIYKYLARGNYLTTNSMLSRRVHDFYFDESLKSFEDWDYWVRIFYQKKKISYINEFLCYARLHNSNMSNNRYEMLENEILVLKKMQKNRLYLDKINYVLFKENYKAGNQIYWEYLKRLIRSNIFIFIKALLYLVYNKINGKLFDPYDY